MQLSDGQRVSRARFREYLANTYGKDNAALMMNIAELESNFRADATNSTSSAAGLMQITAGHWQTLSNSIRSKVARGEMSAADLPSGMTLENIGNFDMHKFDEISSAFMTRENIDFWGNNYVRRANRQRELNGKPPVSDMAELTGGNFALEAFLIAGAHKDGGGVHTSGTLEGTGFGVAIKDGDVDLDNLFTSYQAARQRNDRAGNPITDGMGHGLSYAMYASDNVMESSGGPKLQLRPDQIKTGLSLKAPNVRVNHAIATPWIDRAQQIDPGFEPDDANFDQWLQRLDFADPDAVAGANDIVSTSVVPDFQNENLPRSREIGAVAVPEGRVVSEDPSVSARAENRNGNRIQREVSDAFGAALNFVVPAAQASEAPQPSNGPLRAAPAPEAAPDPLRDSGTTRSGRNPITGQTTRTTSDGSDRNPLTGQRESDNRRTTIDPFSGNRIDTQDIAAPQDLDTGEFSGLDFNEPTLADIANGTARTPIDPVTASPFLEDDTPGNQVQREIERLAGQLEIVDQRDRLVSAGLIDDANVRAAELAGEVQQDLALSLLPDFDLSNRPLQALAQPSLADFAVPNLPTTSVGDITPSNTQLANIVDVSRLDENDFLRQAGREVLADQEFGSIADFINASRGTVVPTSESILNQNADAARIALDQFTQGNLDGSVIPTLRGLGDQNQQLINELSGSLINSSRGF